MRPVRPYQNILTLSSSKREAIWLVLRQAQDEGSHKVCESKGSSP